MYSSGPHPKSRSLGLDGRHAVQSQFAHGLGGFGGGGFFTLLVFTGGIATKGHPHFTGGICTKGPHFTGGIGT